MKKATLSLLFALAIAGSALALDLGDVLQKNAGHTARVFLKNYEFDMKGAIIEVIDGYLLLKGNNTTVYIKLEDIGITIIDQDVTRK